MELKLAAVAAAVLHVPKLLIEPNGIEICLPPWSEKELIHF